jgi:multidrug efflux pump subunit AcrB/ABC-type multidrug transport system ATPase subunit
MLFIALTLLGYVSYKQLPVELLPNAELPVLYVGVASQQDMDPNCAESEVIIPLESAISSVGGVEEISSRVGSRQSIIEVKFKKNVNFKITALKLQEKINETATSFPEDFMVQVQKIDMSQMLSSNFMRLQVRGSGGTDRVRNVVEKEIRTELENIDGVAAVNVYGGRERAIEIRLDPDACKALNLTPSVISGLLSQNMQDKAFVGFANEPSGKYFVHVNSPYTKVSDLENIVVASGPVLLKDVAAVFFDLKEETTYSRVNGKDAVSVNLANDSQANLIELSHRVTDVIGTLNEKLEPLDIEISVQNDTAEIMEKNINQIINLAITGGLLAVLILWFFLRNVRLVLIIALSIPVSVFTAFNFFYAFGITINSLTLVGMALAVGMLLDNSVVVLENVYRLSGAGYAAERAVTQGTREVWRSILAATLTTITVFLPFVFSENFLIKLLGNNIGVSIISTLSISLLVALLFVPMAVYAILRRKRDNSVFYEKVSVTQRPVQIYLVLLKTCMRHPGAVLLGSIVILFVTLALSLALTLSQAKEAESDKVDVHVEMQAGSTLDVTDKAVRVMEERLADFPEKKDLSCWIQEKEAMLTLTLKEDYRKIGKRNIAEIKAEVHRKLSNINGAEISLSSGVSSGGGSAMSGMAGFMYMLGVGDNRERIVIKGSDFDLMQVVAEDMHYYLDEQEYIRNSRVSFDRRQPELLLNFDPILLTSYSITQANITQGLMSLNPEMQSGTAFKVGEDSYDIVIRNNIPEEEEEKAKRKEKTVDDLRAVQIRNANGGLHELKDLAAINHGRGRSQIYRVNQDKQIEVFYSFSREVESSKNLLEGYRADIDRLVANYNLPAGIAVQVFHEEDILGDFKFLLLAAFILIFMILASVFESFSTPFVLLFSIPLAAIGSLLALLVTGNSLLNTNTLTGFLILLGVVVNNSIILIDYSNILRKQGYRRNRALMTAGLSRVRPILITSITTIVAMFPLAMGKSEYAGAIGAPFAITVIGGLSFSALLTLILVPSACMGLENTLKWYRTLPLRTQIFHLLLFVAGVFCIYRYVETLLWQSICLVGLVILIPGLTYFMQASLRRARTRLIAPGDPISIDVRNLVKIYDWPGRFRRQWTSGLKIRRRLGITNEFRSLKDLAGLTWQFGLLLFGAWFAYFAIEKRFWTFLLSFAVYAGAIYLWERIRQYLDYRFAGKRRVRWISRLIWWGIPLATLFALYRRMDNPNLVIVTAVVWALCAVIYRTSRKLYDQNINVERARGRLRRIWYRLVKSIPVIGKQRKPFKALRGVSFEIKTGMFGLLGPNGAGKSTLMRIVCGILEQSYGSIWINGLDTRVYREELQSLIGFLPQEFGTYENMTSWEFLDYQAILKGVVDGKLRSERIEYVLKAVHMYECRDDRIGSFSGGMKQRIGIALILLHLPRILIVDEPTAGLDPRERIRFRNLLVELSRDRVVIFSTHIIEDISSSCNQVVVVDRGDMKYFGNPAEMVGLAAGKVWNFRIGTDEFDTSLDKTMVVHHIQDGDTIQVRYLADQQPFEYAIPAEPNLEDAYLCLLKNMK